MESTLQYVGRISFRILAVTLLLLVVAGALCLVGSQCTLFNYGGLLQFIGIGAAVVGALATAGNFANAGDWTYQFGRSVSVANLPERTMQETYERTRRESLVTLLAIAGVLALIAGTVIQSATLR